MTRHSLFAAAIAIALTLTSLPSLGKELIVLDWPAAHISSDRFESHAAFDPRTGDLYFVRSSPAFEEWRILTARCGIAGWSEPDEPPWAGDGVEADPWFTRSGDEVYFISTRTSDGIRKNDLDIWRVGRDRAGQWQTPERLPAPINSDRNEWFPRLQPNGWLYFGSGRSGGFGKTDLYRARKRNGQWTVENLGAAVNTDGNEFEGELSYDGRMLLIMTDEGLYQSSRRGRQWSPRTKLPPPINQSAGEVGPLFSRAGNVLYSQDLKGTRSGEFRIWRRAPSEAWPRVCPRKY